MKNKEITIKIIRDIINDYNIDKKEKIKRLNEFKDNIEIIFEPIYECMSKTCVTNNISIPIHALVTDEIISLKNKIIREIDDTIINL